MAGYNWNHGMSNNAIAAYNNNLVPASKIGGIPAALVKKHCRYEEWHHCSKAFTKVEFYNASCVKVQFGLAAECDCGGCEVNELAVAALAAFKSKGIEIHRNQRVEWIEWSGSLKRPVATQRVADGCTVEVKKQSATVTFADGTTMLKRLSTKGFRFMSAECAAQEDAARAAEPVRMQHVNLFRAARAAGIAVYDRWHHEAVNYQEAA